MTAEQLEAARAERLRQNGHGAITIEDVRTWIEETGLCIFLPRSAQAGFTAPTFVEAVAGQRTTEPTLELIASAESLLVRLEAEGVAVRLNLAGQPGDQPDYVVAGWVLPYIYALRGDRDWRRAPQLTGSRQVSPLAVQAAKQLESANQTASQIRDALGRETTETAVLRALHELWKQLRVIPVVPEVGKSALWQPLRQRFQKAIAEGASTSQVTAISVLASIYLQAVIAASMEDVEMFLSPLTSRSKIREVVRGLAATRQVHSTTIGHGPMYYVAGTLPEFPAAPSYQSGIQPTYRNSGYRSPSYMDDYTDVVLGHDKEHAHHGLKHDLGQGIDEAPARSVAQKELDSRVELAASALEELITPAASARPAEQPAAATQRHKPTVRNTGNAASAAPRPRAGKSAGAPHPRERSRSSGSFSNGNARHAANGHSAAKPAAPSKNGARKPAQPGRPAWGNAAANGNGSHAANGNSAQPASGARPANGSRPANTARPGSARPGSARPGSRTESHPVSRTSGVAANGRPSANGAKHSGAHAGKQVSAAPHRNGVKPASSNGARSDSRNRSTSARPLSKPAARPATGRSRAGEEAKREPAASKRYSFSGQAKQAPKPAKRTAPAKPAAAGSRTAASSSRSARPAHSSRPAAAKRRG